MSYSFCYEPREWFKGRHTVMFALRDPDMVAHRPSKRCPSEMPHLMTECGEFKKKLFLNSSLESSPKRTKLLIYGAPGAIRTPDLLVRSD